MTGTQYTYEGRGDGVTVCSAGLQALTLPGRLALSWS